MQKKSFAPTHHCWWGEHLIRCLLSEQSLLLLLQLQGFQRCRCTPEGGHIQFVLFFLFPFKSSFFLSLKIARFNLPSEYFSYSHLIVICKTRIACDNVGDQSCICFFSFTTAQAQTKTCRKGRGGEVASKLSFWSWRWIMMQMFIR